MRAWIGSWLIAIVAVWAVTAQALAGTGTVTVKWYTAGILKFALTPNYNALYGAVPASFGATPAPTHGPGACFQACAVDFGTVEAGMTYLYRYAAHLNIFSNDTNGFNVYGEGAADFTDGGANRMTLAQTLFYLPSGASTDTNTGFSPGFAFNVTSGTVNPAVPDPIATPTITYATYPAPMYTSTTESNDYYQDYQMKVPATAATASYFVWIVYTVVPR